MIKFFLPMIPPTITQQEHKVTVRNGKPVFYDPPELKAARQLLMDAVGRFAPELPIRGPVRLLTKWIWPMEKLPMMQLIPEDFHQWKTSKPDTDNVIKLLKDCMTRTGFWKDDAQVCSEITEKFLGVTPGIFIQVEEL